jgi:hypothetical protein
MMELSQEQLNQLVDSAESLTDESLGSILISLAAKMVMRRANPKVILRARDGIELVFVMRQCDENELG